MSENTSSANVSPAMIPRLIHAAMCLGVILFGVVVHFFVRPNQPQRELPPMALTVLIGLSLLASAASFLFLRPRIPRRSRDESADLYWQRASQPALIAWSVFEAGALAGIVAYLLFGSFAALGCAAVGLVGMIAHRPGHLDRAA